MGRLSEEQALKNAEMVQKFAAKIPDLNTILKKVGDEFFLAPASSKEEYHGCYPGGLCDHSLRVAKNLVSLADTLAPGKYKPDHLVLLGLIHDLGKVGDVGIPFYIPEKESWKRQRGWLYDLNKELPYMPTCDRTMYLLNKLGICLDAEEYIAIRISDGPYEKSNEKYNMKEPDLAVLLHFADRWACQQEKQS
jgi:hypothetical protein